MTSVISLNSTSSQTLTEDTSSAPLLVESSGSFDGAGKAMSPMVVEEVPLGCGLMIFLEKEEEEETTNSHASLANYSISIDTKVQDRHYPYIHPNCYAPAVLQNVHLLYGGGSGTAVFGGYHTVLRQSVVMKHGNAKDTKEVLALVTIAKELDRRGRLQGAEAERAARDMKGRIPEFIYLYISRCHIRDRNSELWATVRSQKLEASARKSRRASDVWMMASSRSTMTYDTSVFYKRPVHSASKAQGREHHFSFLNDSLSERTGSSIFASPTINNNTKVFDSPGSTQRRLRVICYDKQESGDTNSPSDMENEDDEEDDGSDMAWSVGFSGVDIPIPAHIFQHSQSRSRNHSTQQSTTLLQCSTDAMAQFFQDFGKELCQQAERHNWKVTLAQKWIGGCGRPSEDESGRTLQARNGADVLTSGELQGPLLDTLIQGIMSIMQDLDLLTLQEERHERFYKIQKEVEHLRRTQNIYDVTPMVDLFVGKCIMKNFHPEKGRFAVMRWICHDMYSPNSDLFLNEKEQVPARFLGKLFQPNHVMEDVFVDPPASTFPLDAIERMGWYDLLHHATQFCQTSFAVATDCIWTCGLTDAGLHNTFLSVERGLELFDLGEPGLEPRPAFLTKFLMSFFHTSGMESDGNNSWKKRFVVVAHANGDERLALTAETEEKIPYIREVFTATLDRIMNHIFLDDPRVRSLMIKYVVLQLLSDAGFCLQRWEAKGGGEQRYGERTNDPLEKWLWRSLWDIYIASYVHTVLLLDEEKCV